MSQYNLNIIINLNDNIHHYRIFLLTHEIIFVICLHTRHFKNIASITETI